MLKVRYDGVNAMQIHIDGNMKVVNSGDVIEITDNVFSQIQHAGFSIDKQEDKNAADENILTEQPNKYRRKKNIEQTIQTEENGGTQNG